MLIFFCIAVKGAIVNSINSGVSGLNVTKIARDGIEGRRGGKRWGRTAPIIR